MAVGQNPVLLVNIKIGGTWVFIRWDRVDSARFPTQPLPAGSPGARSASRAGGTAPGARGCPGPRPSRPPGSPPGPPGRPGSPGRPGGGGRRDPPAWRPEIGVSHAASQKPPRGFLFPSPEPKFDLGRRFFRVQQMNHPSPSISNMSEEAWCVQRQRVPSPPAHTAARPPPCTHEPAHSSRPGGGWKPIRQSPTPALPRFAWVPAKDGRPEETKTIKGLDFPRGKNVPSQGKK